MWFLIKQTHKFKVHTVGQYIKKTQESIELEEKSKFIQFENIFYKIYVRHLQQSKKMLEYRTYYRNTCLMGNAPANTIAEYFYKKSNFYSQQFLTETFEALGKAYLISKNDNSGSLEPLGYKLFNNPEFLNLAEEFKYGLKNNKIKFGNLSKIARALIQMGYVDYEIINLLLLYTKRYLQGKEMIEPLKQWPGDRQFQIEKKNYYKFGEEELKKFIRESAELQLALKQVKQIYAEIIAEKQKDIILRENVAKQINSLIEQISTTNQSFKKLTQAIINIRRQYLKMVDFSSNIQILRNPLLNHQLLEIEQKLLLANIINLEDRRYPQNMKNKTYEIRRVQQIILTVLKVDSLDSIFPFIDDGTSKIEGKDLYAPNSGVLSELADILAEFGCLDRHLYCNLDGKSLATLRLEKTLLKRSRLDEQSDLKQKLNVSRIFRKAYRDIYLFLLSNFDRMILHFQIDKLDDKVQILASLCKLGLHEKALELFQRYHEKFGKKVIELSSKQFAHLIQIFNDLGIYSNNIQLKKQILNAIASQTALEEYNEINNSLHSTINVLNYLLQNHDLSDQLVKNIYEHQINILDKKTNYYNGNLEEQETVIEAIKILSLERPAKYQSHPGLIHYLSKLNESQFRTNPYYDIFRQTCYKFAKMETNQLFSPFLKIGFSKGKQHGLYLSNADETSISGQIRSGNLNSMIMRLQSVNRAKILQIAVNQLYQLDYSENTVVKMKASSFMEQKLNQVFNQKSEQFDIFFTKIWNSVETILGFHKASQIGKILIFKLQNILNLKKKQPKFNTVQQQITRKSQLILKFLDLKKLVILIENGKLEEIKKPIQNNNSAKTIQNAFKDAYYFTDSIIGILQQEITSLNPKKVDKSAESIVNLDGRRQSIQTFDIKNSDFGSVSSEFLNQTYYNSNEYFEYFDWKQLVEKYYQFAEFDYDKLSVINKILVNKFCPKLKNKISLLPLIKHQENIKIVDIQPQIFDQIQDHSISTQVIPSNQKVISSIINLQNFKHELKSSYSKNQILEYILNFKFISQLKQDSNVSEYLLLPRNPEEYFNYLEYQSQNRYLQSPYARYIMEKLSRTENIKELLQKRKLTRMNQRLLFQRGQITTKTYYQRIKQVQNQIISALRGLENKIIDSMAGSLLEGSLKMVKINKQEIEQFKNIITRQNFYSRQFDQDFIYANGNYKLALNLKRGRAQNNFTKFAILKRVTEEKPLKESDKQFINKWKKQIQKAVSITVVYPRYTRLQIKDLFLDDQQKLKLKATSLTKHGDMFLIDLIMELNHFLDESVIQNFQKHQKADTFFHMYNIPKEMFTNSNNKEFAELSLLMEQQLLVESSKLTNKELDTVEQMFKVYKTEGYKQRLRYDIFCKNFRPNIEMMNEKFYRNELISEYIRLLGGQFMKEYNPALIREMKDREVDSLWKEVFKKPEIACSQQMIRSVTKKIILRLKAMGNRTPPYFGHLIIKILSHPLNDQLTRETLIAALQKYNIDINIDSQDLLQLFAINQQSIKSINIQQGLKKICNKNFTAALSEKMNILL